MTKTCPHCKNELPFGDEYKQHVRKCFFEQKGDFLKKKEGKLDLAVQIREQNERIQKIMGFFKKIRKLDDNSVFHNENLTMLKPLQFKAVEAVVNGAKIRSEAARETILGRLRNLNYGEDDLKKIEVYLRDRAPLLIHINLPNILHHLLKDDHYRNTFEISGFNSTRHRVENGLFNNFYDKAEPFDRVKYGALNILNDPQGITHAYGYGDSYLVMKNVRMRTSFTNHDTFGHIINIACCEHYLHVLNEFNDAALAGVTQIARGEVPFLRSNNVPVATYKEVQYHGPVRLYHDVECLVANPKYRNDGKITKQLQDFEFKFDVPVFWMDEYEKVLSS